MNTFAPHKTRMFLCLSVLVFSGVFLGFVCSPSFAGDVKQKSYTTPEEAVSALVAAVRADNVDELLSILGPDGRDLISSGDQAADIRGRRKFIKSYDVKNVIEAISPGKMVLHVGKDNWTMPIPIVRKDNRWIFDSKAGRQEILDRRIGRNELNVMDVLRAYVAAQYAYAKDDRSAGGDGQFAQKIISTPGKHDGLYWEAKEGQDMSPLGPLVAEAAQEGYASSAEEIALSPFHGYYFRVLRGQGKHAQGGSYSYVVKGKMILGFGLVAYPAQHGNSGVMTFIVNQEGVIYEKNLGKETTKTAESIKLFDPGKTWKKVEDKGK